MAQYSPVDFFLDGYDSRDTLRVSEHHLIESPGVMVRYSPAAGLLDGHDSRDTSRIPEHYLDEAPGVMISYSPIDFSLHGHDSREALSNSEQREAQHRGSKTTPYLPTELLCNIFEMLSEPDHHDHESSGALRLKDLLHAQSVCRTWRSAIQTSSSLQAKLYLISPRSGSPQNWPEINPLLVRYLPVSKMEIFEDLPFLGCTISDPTARNLVATGDWVISMEINRQEFERWLRTMPSECLPNQHSARLVPTCTHMRFATGLVDTMVVTSMEESPDYSRMWESWQIGMPWPWAQKPPQPRQHITRLREHTHEGLGQALPATPCPIIGGEHDCGQCTENGVTVGMLIAAAKKVFAENDESSAPLRVYMRLSKAE